MNARAAVFSGYSGVLNFATHPGTIGGEEGPDNPVREPTRGGLVVAKTIWQKHREQVLYPLLRSAPGRYTERNGCRCYEVEGAGLVGRRTWVVVALIGNGGGTDRGAVWEDYELGARGNHGYFALNADAEALRILAARGVA